MELEVDGDISADDGARPTIVIMNHQIDTDWFIAMAFLERICSGRLKIILKSQLKTAPVLGTGCMLFGYIFVKRRWDQDKGTMDRQLRDLLCNMASPMWLLIYPEGNTIHTEAIQRSHDFAASSQPARPQFNNLLLPRTTGVTFALQLLEEVGGGARIVDLTVAYDGYRGEIPTYAQGYSRAKDVEVPSSYGMLGAPFFGKPLRVHISAREVQVSSEEKRSGRWLDKCWERKERLLDHFQAHQAFPEEDGVRRETVVVRPASTFEAMLPLAMVATVTAGVFCWMRQRK